MNEPASAPEKILKYAEGILTETNDFLAREEPLEIRLTYGRDNNRKTDSISVTMRTPGNDEELAAGFLYTEGILRHKVDVKSIAVKEENTVDVVLTETSEPDLEKLHRNFYTSSSCGVCGKSSIDSVRLVLPQQVENTFSFSAERLQLLPSLLKENQNVFNQTGGLHASALFNEAGNLEILREDVGRHNALDKLIGSAFLKDLLPLSQHLLLLSGRTSFELIQKAAMAGIQIVAAVGAPSSLALELAKESGITLIGFLKPNRFNIYCRENRIDFKHINATSE